MAKDDDGLARLVALAADGGGARPALARVVAAATECLDGRILALAHRADPLAESFTAGPGAAGMAPRVRDALEEALTAFLGELDEERTADTVVVRPLPRVPAGIEGSVVCVAAMGGGSWTSVLAVDGGVGSVPAAAAAVATVVALAADRCRVETERDLARRGLDLVAGVYGRFLGGEGDRRTFGYAVERLRALVGYDLFALALPEGDGWRVIWRLPSAVDDALVSSARDELGTVLERDLGVAPEAVRTDWIYEDGPAPGGRDAVRVESSVILPLVLPSGRRTEGLMAFFSGTAGFFTTSHLRLLGTLSPGLTAAIRGAEHVQDLEDRHAAFTEQLDLAAQIQEGLLPAAPPVTAGYLIGQRHRQARGVGGDFFAYHLSPDGTLAVALADVAGKGIPAALLASFVLGALRTVWSSTTEPVTVLDRLDGMLAQSMDPFRFVTMACVELRGRRLRYATAGHEPVLLAREGAEPEELSTTGLPLGVRAGGGHGGGERELRPGDLLLLYTDGLSEARRSDRTLFGRDRLRRWLAEAGAPAPDAVVADLFTRVEEFFGGDEPSDDQTAVAVKVVR